MLGDSITELGAEPGGYVRLLERWLGELDPAHPAEVVNAGVSGQRSPDMLARFAVDVVERRPDLVLISVGTNDVWHAFRDWSTNMDHPAGDLPAGVSLDAFVACLDAMASQAEAGGIEVVLVSPAVIHEDLDSPENIRLASYVRAQHELAAARGCRFVDLHTPFGLVIGAWRRHAGPAMNLLTTDGVHLNAAGNHLMAETIQRALEAGGRADWPQ
ncbi:MAG TPA: GDSL-type esterase/lipase family protein [Vicinamibacterales bacterium]